MIFCTRVNIVFYLEKYNVYGKISVSNYDIERKKFDVRIKKYMFYKR